MLFRNHEVTLAKETGQTDGGKTQGDNDVAITYTNGKSRSGVPPQCFVLTHSHSMK